MAKYIAKVNLVISVEVSVEIPDGTTSPHDYAEKHAKKYVKHALTDWGDLSLSKIIKGDGSVIFVEKEAL